MGTRAAIVAWLSMLLVAGCAQRTAGRTYPTPREIVLDSATGEWTVLCEGESRAEELQESIRASTITPEGKKDGLVLAPGSAGYARTLLNRPWSANSQGLTVPSFVEYRGSVWTARMRTAVLYSEDVQRAGAIGLELTVPLKRPGATRSAQSSLAKEQRPL